MSDPGELLRQRARDWHYDSHAGVCDHLEPWEHGTVIRAARYPTYYSFNAVRVEDEPGMSAEELTAFAAGELAGLEHLPLHCQHIAPRAAPRAGLPARA